MNVMSVDTCTEPAVYIPGSDECDACDAFAARLERIEHLLAGLERIEISKTDSSGEITTVTLVGYASVTIDEEEGGDEGGGE